jgi:hypothetical protein
VDFSINVIKGLIVRPRRAVFVISLDMNIQHFSISALADIVMEDPVETSDNYDDSAYYDEDFEHESHGVSMSRDQNNDISVIQGDGENTLLHETVDRDESNAYLSDGDHEELKGGDDSGDLLEAFRQRQQATDFTAKRSPEARISSSSSVNAVNERSVEHSPVIAIGSHGEKKSEDSPVSQSSTHSTKKSRVNMSRMQHGHAKTPFSRVGVISRHLIPGHPQHQASQTSSQQECKATERGGGSDIRSLSQGYNKMSAGALYGISDEDLHAMRLARSVLDRLEARQAQGDIAATTMVRLKPC